MSQPLECVKRWPPQPMPLYTPRWPEWGSKRYWEQVENVSANELRWRLHKLPARGPYGEPYVLEQLRRFAELATGDTGRLYRPWDKRIEWWVYRAPGLQMYLRYPGFRMDLQHTDWWIGMRKVGGPWLWLKEEPSVVWFDTRIRLHSGVALKPWLRPGDEEEDPTPAEALRWMLWNQAVQVVGESGLRIACDPWVASEENLQVDGPQSQLAQEMVGTRE